MSQLFSSLKIREIEFRNRVFVSPMCQYSCEDGVVTDWHLVHLGSRAVGGAGLVMVEATGVCPAGRISPADSGLWSEKHVEAFKPIVEFIKSQGSVPGIQLAHAGRKASTDAPWRGGKPLSHADGGWQPVGPSPIPFAEGYQTPREMTAADIDQAISHFVRATEMSLRAGFEVIELHMAHGYLMHEFLSPLANQRRDEYGGDFKGRTRFPTRIAEAVRRAWPAEFPLFVRISATDWVDGGWDLAQTIEFSRGLKEIGVDLIDCSSGGQVATAKIPVGAGYQTPFATAVRKEVGILTGAVGVIIDAHQAEQIIATEQADVVFLARAMLRDPYWPLHAARSLGVKIPWPVQYERARD